MLLLGSLAFGVEDERRKPLEPEKPKEPPPVAIPEAKPNIPDEEKVLVEKLVGVRFVGKTDDVVKQTEEAGVFVVNVPRLDSDEFRARIQPFIDKPISLKSIKEIAREVILYFRQQDRPFVSVSIPEQDITTGVVQLLVVEGKLGKITVEGNKWFKGKQFLSQMGLKGGEAISEKRIIRDIDYLNQNSFRQVRPVFKPGADPGTTDLTLKVEDRFPVRFYTGYEDTGTQVTGIDRLIAGFNWNNAFNRGHEIGYQFAGDIDFQRQLSHSGYWRIPLPNRDKLSLTFGYSEVEAPLNQDLTNGGTSWQAGMRYSKTLPSVAGIHHQMEAGVDVKETDNNLDFGGTEVFASKVRTAHIAVGYSGTTFDKWGSTYFGLNGYFSPGHTTAFQTVKAYRQARERSDPQYIYETLTLERTWKLPKGMTLVNRFYGQVADERLMSSEQILLGGAYSVRGYDDRLVVGDHGLQGSIELRSPFIPLGKIKDDDRFESKLQVLVFWDYGLAHIVAPAFNERRSTDMESVGGGFRYRLGTYLNLRFDYGYKLKDLAPNLDGGDPGRIHLGVVGSF
ncbi:MAG: ShlB/FhaC/HecB family hemolysin secretion/activation protein [Planctomycetota bacterium]|nr:ShlB/FhaC/HecB family hemolysin secretion/activation protein [Planctomycetota bacterium]